MDKFENSPKIFALADCNAFFCSCEQLFRPELRGRPVGVLSNNDGCFVSRTKELKALGIPMGAPYFKYRDICRQHKASVFSSNFALYTDISTRVMKTLSSFSHNLEVYSVDEAFLDFSPFRHLNLYDYGIEIKQTIARYIGIPISIGIAPTRTLSKVANHWAKKKTQSGVCLLTTKGEYTDAVLEQTPLIDVWGIGRRTVEKLNALGIKNAREFRDFDNDQLIKKLFHKTGRQTQNELRGIACISLKPQEQKKKSILCSRTFPKKTEDITILKQSIANYISYATKKLRDQESITHGLDVFYRTDPHHKEQAFIKRNLSSKLATGSSFTPELIKAAWKLIENDSSVNIPYRKAGVLFYHLEDQQERQLGLFEQLISPETIKKQEELMQVMDSINQRFGKNTLKSLACGVESKELWQMKRNQKSPAYTTEWDELYQLR